MHRHRQTLFEIRLRQWANMAGGLVPFVATSHSQSRKSAASWRGSNQIQNWRWTQLLKTIYFKLSTSKYKYSFGTCTYMYLYCCEIRDCDVEIRGFLQANSLNYSYYDYNYNSTRYQYVDVEVCWSSRCHANHKQSTHILGLQSKQYQSSKNWIIKITDFLSSAYHFYKTSLWNTKILPPGSKYLTFTDVIVYCSTAAT